MTTSLKSAVIGAGWIAQHHLTFLHRSRCAQLVGVCDHSAAAARDAADRFEAVAPFTDHRQMLAEAKPEVVHVLTPVHTHMTIASQCLESGAHVIVEKPIAPTHQQFRELFDTATRCGRHLIEDHNYRFNEPVRAIEQLIEEGVLGQVRDLEVRLCLGIRSEGSPYSDLNLPHPSHRLPGGAIHEFITHLSYLALRFLPSFDRVSAAWSNHGGGDLFKYDDLDALVIGGPVHARIRFSCHSQPDCFSLCVRGSRGYAETDLFWPSLRCVIPRRGGSQLAPLLNQFAGGIELIGAGLMNLRRKMLGNTPYEGLHLLLARCYEAMLAGEGPPITYDDMDRTSRLVDALLEETNRL